jgi:hypothetical protein
MTPPSAAARTIAAGGNPLFEQTFEHPVHGPLTFRGRLPLATDSLRHSVAIDNLLVELAPGADPSFQTKVVAGAIAGMTVPDNAPAGKALMLELPEVARDPDPEDEGRVRVRYYDAATEASMEFLAEVWLAYSGWRAQMLSDETVEAVGESSGGPAMSSGASSTPSAGATAPPSPTPGS